MPLGSWPRCSPTGAAVDRCFFLEMFIDGSSFKGEPDSAWVLNDITKVSITLNQELLGDAAFPQVGDGSEHTRSAMNVRWSRSSRIVHALEISSFDMALGDVAFLGSPCPACEHAVHLHVNAGCLIRRCDCWLRSDQVVTASFGAISRRAKRGERIAEAIVKPECHQDDCGSHEAADEDPRTHRHMVGT